MSVCGAACQLKAHTLSMAEEMAVRKTGVYRKTHTRVIFVRAGGVKLQRSFT